MVKKIVTHNGSFHADDLFSVALLLLIFPEAEVVRTRDQKEIDEADLVLDVGVTYDPDKKRFDHHQKGGAGKRENSVPYASFGLIWKHFGLELTKNKDAWEYVDLKLVQPIDANDNGFALSEPIMKSVSEYSLQRLTFLFQPTWKEEGSVNMDEIFFSAIPQVKKIIQREIEVADQIVEGWKKVEETYHASEDKQVIVLDRPYPWKSVITLYPEPLFVIYHKKNEDRWHVRSVPESERSFRNRKNLPQSWAGLRDEALQKETGVKDALFCHNNLFFCIAGSKEGALDLVSKAIKN